MNATAQEILKMSRRDILSMFPGEEAQQRKGFVQLLAKWHPDVCADPAAAEVFAHIVKLRDQTFSRKPMSRFERTLVTAGGRKLRISPLNILKADQGEIIVNRNTLATLFPAKYCELARAEAEVIQRFRYADEEMKAQMAPFLPRVLRREELANGDLLVIVRKGPREILLSDLLAREGRMPEAHAAWLCSGLMHICAWLDYAGLVHGAISPENILIDPESHTVRLAAGWAFASRAGRRPQALPARTLSLLPRLALRHETVDSGCDRELVRKTLREALGDPAGTNGAVFALPPAISAWVNGAPADSAVEDYARWQSALETGWGPRRFVEYPLEVADIYHAN